jgi:hypothetical protein
MKLYVRYCEQLNVLTGVIATIQLSLGMAHRIRFRPCVNLSVQHVEHKFIAQRICVHDIERIFSASARIEIALSFSRGYNSPALMNHKEV